MNRNRTARDKVKNLAPQKSKEQIKYERKLRTEDLNTDITCMQRDIDYKRDQIKNGIEETRVINRIPGQPAIIIEGYKNHLKPPHLLENEIDQLNKQIKRNNEQINTMKELQDADTKP